MHKLTPSQESKLTAIRKYHLEDKSYGNKAGYEYKQWGWSFTSRGKVLLFSTVGMVNDEGSAASIFCRDQRVIIIGKGGALTLINAKNGSPTGPLWKLLGVAVY